MKSLLRNGYKHITMRAYYSTTYYNAKTDVVENNETNMANNSFMYLQNPIANYQTGTWRMSEK